MYQDNFFKNENQQGAENRNAELEHLEIKSNVEQQAEPPQESSSSGDIVEQSFGSEPKEEINEIKIGTVTGCAKLNVRREPKFDAAIACEVVHQAELMISQNGSTDEFYKVCTTSGIEGFCMRRFISVQP